MRLAPGRWLNGQIQLLSWQGEELLGESFLAERRPQGDSLWVKFLTAEACRTPTYLERFRRTAERAMLLSHHSMATVVAFGIYQEDAEEAARLLGAAAQTGSRPKSPHAPGIPWIACETVVGREFRSALHEGMSPKSVGTLLLPVADLLDRAALLGIFHGELVPELLLVLDRGGEPKAQLLDLGIAKPETGDLWEVPMSSGGLLYRSPEQGRPDGRAGPASDRYALATILYEAIAGRTPFVAEDPRTLIGLHRSAPIPPLKSLLPRLEQAAALDAFFVRALAKEPQARFATAMAMMEEFMQALSTHPRSGAREEKRRRSSRWYRLSRKDEPARRMDVVAGPRAVLGKQSECDVVCQALPSPAHDGITATISREHTVLIWLDNRLSVLDQSSNGTFVDERKIGTRLTAIPAGAVLRLGQHLQLRLTGLVDAQVVEGSDLPGVLIERLDTFADGAPKTVMLWQQIAAAASPLAELGGAMRLGDLWVAQRELWWSGDATVSWQRQDGLAVLGPAPLRDGDTLSHKDGVLCVTH